MNFPADTNREGFHGPVPVPIRYYTYAGRTTPEKTLNVKWKEGYTYHRMESMHPCNCDVVDKERATNGSSYTESDWQKQRQSVWGGTYGMKETEKWGKTRGHAAYVSLHVNVIMNSPGTILLACCTASRDCCFW